MTDPTLPPDLADALASARALEADGALREAAARLAETVDRFPAHDAPRIELVALQQRRLDGGDAPPRGELEEALALALLLETSGGPVPAGAVAALASALSA